MSQSDRPEVGPQTHGRMGFDERETLMYYLLIHPGVFVEARQLLTPEHFTEPYELIWAIAWRSCLDLFDQYGRLPAKHMIEADALARIADHPGELPQNGIDEFREFIEFAYGLDPAVFNENGPYGFDLLQKFLKERHWTDPVRRFIQEIGDATPVDVPAVLLDFQTRYSEVQGVTMSVANDLVPAGGLVDETFTIIPTGLPFLDIPMGGGAANGEVYGILGGFGSGKTMMACNISAEAATRSVNLAMTLNRRPRDLFYFSYETPLNDITKRVLAYTAGIKLDHLNAFPYSQTLSRAGRRHPYEEIMFPTDPRGEYERYEDTRAIWSKFHIMDMRGSPNNPKAGSGGIDEIHAELVKHQRRYGTSVDTVVIDYVNVCVKRFIRHRGLDPDRMLRHKIGEFGDEARRLIASHFDCRVWVLNQLSGEANKRSPGAKISHADSAEATNFAENLWYCFCLGMKDRSNNTVVVDCTKTRRSEGAAQPAILELRGDVARCVAADDRYMLDPNTRRVVRRSIGEMIAPDATAARRSAAPRGRSGAQAGLGIP